MNLNIVDLVLISNYVLQTVKALALKNSELLSFKEGDEMGRVLNHYALHSILRVHDNVTKVVITLFD